MTALKQNDRRVIVNGAERVPVTVVNPMPGSLRG